MIATVLHPGNKDVQKERRDEYGRGNSSVLSLFRIDTCTSGQWINAMPSIDHSIMPISKNLVQSRHDLKMLFSSNRCLQAHNAGQNTHWVPPDDLLRNMLLAYRVSLAAGWTLGNDSAGPSNHHFHDSLQSSQWLGLSVFVFLVVIYCPGWSLDPCGHRVPIFWWTIAVEYAQSPLQTHSPQNRHCSQPSAQSHRQMHRPSRFCHKGDDEKQSSVGWGQ